jgi:hypothetical protein
MGRGRAAPKRDTQLPKDARHDAVVGQARSGHREALAIPEDVLLRLHALPREVLGGGGATQRRGAAHHVRA